MCSPKGRESNPQLSLFQEKLCAASVEFFLLSFLKNNKRIHAVRISATAWILLPPCANITEYCSKITRFIQGNIKQYLATRVFVVFLLLQIKSTINDKQEHPPQWMQPGYWSFEGPVMGNAG